MLDGALSQRELEIADAYAAGQTYHQIARHLHIAPSTVRTHLATIYRKLGVSSKIELHDMLSLEEAISRERALGEVLRIISRSQGQLAEVIAAVLDYALELCDAEFGILFEYSDRVGYKAAYSRGIPTAFADWLAGQGAFHVSPQTGLGRLCSSMDVIRVGPGPSRPYRCRRATG